jgi:hypothetical protein
MDMRNGTRVLKFAVIAPALLAAGRLGAAPHEAPPPPVSETVVTPEAGTWLKRLPGGYVFEGAISHEEVIYPDIDEVESDSEELAKEEALGIDPITHKANQRWSRKNWSQPVQGKGNCIEIGAGAGIQCVISVTWPEMWGSLEFSSKANLGTVSFLSPAMILAGVVPDSGAIRFLFVDSRGMGHPGRTTLSGDAANARPACVNMPGVQSCQMTIKIEAKAEAKSYRAVVSNKVRFLRNKTERKPATSAGESPVEWVDEFLDLSFLLRRDEPGAEPAPQ